MAYALLMQGLTGATSINHGSVRAARVGFALANNERNTVDPAQLGRGQLPKEVDSCPHLRVRVAAEDMLLMQRHMQVRLTLSHAESLTETVVRACISGPVLVQKMLKGC